MLQDNKYPHASLTPRWNIAASMNTTVEERNCSSAARTGVGIGVPSLYQPKDSPVKLLRKWPADTLTSPTDGL